MRVQQACRTDRVATLPQPRTPPNHPAPPPVARRSVPTPRPSSETIEPVTGPFLADAVSSPERLVRRSRPGRRAHGLDRHVRPAGHQLHLPHRLVQQHRRTRRPRCRPPPHGRRRAGSARARRPRRRARAPAPAGRRTRRPPRRAAWRPPDPRSSAVSSLSKVCTVSATPSRSATSRRLPRPGRVADHQGRAARSPSSRSAASAEPAVAPPPRTVADRGAATPASASARTMPYTSVFSPCAGPSREDHGVGAADLDGELGDGVEQRQHGPLERHGQRQARPLAVRARRSRPRAAPPRRTRSPRSSSRSARAPRRRPGAGSGESEWAIGEPEHRRPVIRRLSLLFRLNSASKLEELRLRVGELGDALLRVGRHEAQSQSPLAGFSAAWMASSPGLLIGPGGRPRCM